MHPLWYAVAAYGLAEAYKRYVPAETKRKWQNFVQNMHHGEAAIAGLAVGVATGSPSITAASLGLAYHDREDANRWFTGKRDAL